MAFASKAITLLSSPVNSSAPVTDLAEDRPLIAWNRKDLLVTGINTLYLLNSDRGTTENSHSPK